jgi:SAM-dependent methyltransferase
MPFYDFWRNKQVTPYGKYLGHKAAEHVFGRLRSALPELRHLVEIGPGRGAFAAVCRSQGLEYTAVDVNAGLLQSMDGDRVCSFVPPLPLQDAVADAVVASHVIEHAAGLPQAQAMLAEMSRIVRPGGCVVIVSPDLLWMRNYFWDCDYSHSFPVSSRRAHQMFLDAGLEVAHLEYVHNHLTGWRGAVAGRGVELIPYRLPGAQPTSSLYVDRIYKLRMTFGRSVLIIGRRPEAAL